MWGITEGSTWILAHNVHSYNSNRISAEALNVLFSTACIQRPVAHIEAAKAERTVSSCVRISNSGSHVYRVYSVHIGYMVCV